MLVLAAQTLRHRWGTALATFLALAGGIAVLLACGLLVESGLRYHGSPQRYAAATAVVAHRDVTTTVALPMGESDTTVVPLPERGTVPESLVAAVAAVPGVAAAVGEHLVPLVAAAAPEVAATGSGWGSAALAPHTLTAGAPPRAADEVVVDTRLAADAGLAPGSTTEVLVGGTRREYRVSGVAEASWTSAAATSAPVFFTDAEAARLSGRPGRVDAVGVLAEPGADRSAVVTAVERVAADAGATAYAGEDRGLVAQPEAAAARELTVQAGGAFGGYAALIIGFVVASTVGLSVRHRRRDLALLRAVAATPGQVRRMVLGEVALLTLAAAVVGLPAGFAVAAWTRAQLVTRGFVPETFTIQGGLLPAVVVTAGVLVVALLSASAAARRTARIRPTEALGEVAVEPAPASRVRAVAGVLVLAGAVWLVGLARAVDGQSALGAAVGLVYASVTAVALLAPWINLVAARALAPFLRAVWGASGHLAAANLRAGARGMVGVLTALVLSVGFGGTVWFLQDDLARQTVVQSQEGVLAQQVLTSPVGLPASAVAQAREVPGVVAATGVRRTSAVVPVEVGAMAVPAQGIDVEGADRTLDLDVTQGRLADLREGSVAVSTAQAEASGWELGETVDLWLGDGTPVQLQLVATYERGLGFGDVTFDRQTLTGHTTAGTDDQVLITTAEGSGPAALEDFAARYPGARVVTSDQLTGEVARDLAIGAWLNKLLVGVLVGYAALAAANTLVMAALARGRELSLLRLVGMTRGQVGRMVTAEQAGLLGVALAIGTGITAVSLSSIMGAIAGQRIPHVPVGGWVVVIGGTTALALVATMLPVHRALRTAPVQGIGLRE